jgi:hypothetical protein
MANRAHWMSSTISAHVYEVRPRRDHRVLDLISDGPPFGRPWYREPEAISNAIGYAKFYSRSRDAMIRAYDEEDNVIETHRILSVKSKGYFPKGPER